MGHILHLASAITPVDQFPRGLVLRIFSTHFFCTIHVKAPFPTACTYLAVYHLLVINAIGSMICCTISVGLLTWLRRRTRCRFSCCVWGDFTSCWRDPQTVFYEPTAYDGGATRRRGAGNVGVTGPRSEGGKAAAGVPRVVEWTRRRLRRCVRQITSSCVYARARRTIETYRIVITIIE